MQNKHYSETDFLLLRQTEHVCFLSVSDCAVVGHMVSDRPSGRGLEPLPINLHDVVRVNEGASLRLCETFSVTFVFQLQQKEWKKYMSRKRTKIKKIKPNGKIGERMENRWRSKKKEGNK